MTTPRNPLDTLTSRICVLTLSIYPRRKEKLMEHLTQDCGFPEERIHVCSGKIRDNVVRSTNSAENNELSILDCLSLNENMMDEVSDNIFENHVNMIRTAYLEYSGDPWILFLEDDARFDKSLFSPEMAQDVVQFMSSGAAEVMLLGMIPFWKGVGVPLATYSTRSVVRHWTMTLCAHAYLLTRPAMEKILETADRFKKMKDMNNMNNTNNNTQKPPRMHFDMLFHYLGMKVNSISPMVCFQNRDPALYQRFQTMMPLLQFFSFRQVSIGLYRLAIFIPLFFMLLMIVCLYTLVLKTRDHLTTRLTLQVKKEE